MAKKNPRKNTSARRKLQIKEALEQQQIKKEEELNNDIKKAATTCVIVCAVLCAVIVLFALGMRYGV